MKLPRRTAFRSGAIALLASGLLTCTDGPPAGPNDSAPPLFLAADVFEVDHFFWLPPLVSNPNPTGVFNPNLAPVPVEICEWDGAACIGATLTLQAFVQTDHYQVNWNTNVADLAKTFRIRALLGGVELGHVDVVLESTGNIKAGSTIPVKFRIEEGLSGSGEFYKNIADISPDGGDLTAVNEIFNPVGVASFPAGWSPDGQNRVIAMDCTRDGFTPPDGPLDTPLDQWPLYCTLQAFPPLPPGTPFPNPATLAICQVDEQIGGQGGFHGFDRPGLRLGQQSGGNPVIIHPPVSTSAVLACEGTIYTASAEHLEPDGVWSEVGRTFASVFSFFGPQPLMATSTVRDGGIGGLITSFSEFAGVETSTITGTVSTPIGPLAGVTLTLSGDASGTFTTGADGTYTFDGLDVGTYTVTITGGIPAGIVFAVTSQTATIDETETIVLDFVGDFIPGFDYQESWKYQLIGTNPPPAGFHAPGFDDSGFATSMAPFWEDPKGSLKCAVTQDAAAGGLGTLWPVGKQPTRQSDILLRRKFYVPSWGTAVKVWVAVDNDIRVWINGVDVTANITGDGIHTGPDDAPTSLGLRGIGGKHDTAGFAPDGLLQHAGCTALDDIVFSAGASWNVGENTIAIHARDRGQVSFFDARVTVVP